MNESDHRARYETRLARVLDHIYDHLDEPLDIERLAEIACLSPYHWHRIYQAMYGETVATTVRRLRLHRAAGFLRIVRCREAADAPVFEEYLNGPKETAPAELVTEICLPLG